MNSSFSQTLRSVSRRTVAAAAAATTIGLAALTVGTGSTDVRADEVVQGRVSSPDMAAQARQTLDSYRAWQEARQPMSWVEFVDRRDQFAVDLSVALGTDPNALLAEWANAPVSNQVIVLSALTQLGVRYRYNSMKADGSFDCSGLTKWAYSQAGVELPRVSSSQIRSATRIERESLTPGDLVYYPGHIGLYLGQGGFIDAPNSGNVIRVAGSLPGRSLRFGDATP